MRVLGQVDDVGDTLAVAADLIGGTLGAEHRCVERHHACVVVVVAIHGARAEAEDEAQHALRGIDALVPHVRVERVAHAADVRVVQVTVELARDALHEERHLLVAVDEAAVQPVGEGLLAHRARVDGAHGRDELGQTLLRITLVAAEHALVLAGEGVAVRVLEQAGGAHDHR